MSSPKKFLKSSLAATIAAMALSVSPAHAKPFVLEEATVDSIHAAYRDGSLTATELVKRYLARIDAYDQKGPSLRAFITVNPDALAEAARLDAEFKAKKGNVGPLFGIPIVLKDNYNTKDMPTSGGNLAMKNSRPPADAFTVDRIRRAGAIILGKTNLQEFARGGVSNSSLGGQVLNPYDLTRTPGGSSGGTGVALATNMAVLGTGSDTGQSIRSPAAANSLVGVRPTRGLVSRGGVMPNSFTQDEVGPLARTVKDAALLLDVMAGYDPRDPITALGVGKRPADYVAALKGATLKGARIGVLANVYGKEERHAEVNRVMEQVMRTMEAQGAIVVRFDLPAYDKLAGNVGTDRYEARAAFDQYFAELGPNQPVTSFRQLVDSKTATPDVQKTMEAEIAIDDGLNNATYRERTLNREKLRILLASKMADLQLDAILYPLQRVLPALAGGVDQPERNGVLSHGTGLPAVTFPGGFSTPTATAPIGVPVGAELLGLDYTEPKLLALAYAFEQAAHVRKLPVSTPPLR
jgi:Asp-tRNA(Asn)/Glu-tRNA(Gln) amidotransferase A subunit family amidase